MLFFCLLPVSERRGLNRLRFWQRDSIGFAQIRHIDEFASPKAEATPNSESPQKRDYAWDANQFTPVRAYPAFFSGFNRARIRWTYSTPARRLALEDREVKNPAGRHNNQRGRFFDRRPHLLRRAARI